MNTAIRMLTTLCLCLMLSLAASAQTKRSDAKVRIGGEDFYVHAVAKGDTFYSLGKLYNVADTIIVRHNPLTSDGLKVGQMIKIPVVAPAAAPAKPTPRKGFRQHVVQKGETAYSISKLYGIPLATLIEDNKEIDPLHISEGAVLYIRKKEQGDASPAEIHQQWVEYKEAINSVSDDMIYHIVQPGETLYSLGKQYGVEVDVIAEANGITDGNLRVLSMIRIPVAKPEAETKADSTAVAVPTIDAPSQVLSSALSKSQKAEVALMLPLQGGEKSNRNFLDFYQGVMVALDEIKQDGLAVDLRVFNTARNPEKINEIVCSEEFSGIDLVIGPVYNDELAPVLRFAEAKQISVISPLATVNVSSPVLYQAAPDAATKYDKLDSLIHRSGNVVIVTTEKEDKEFTREMRGWLGTTPYRIYNYNSATDAGEIVGIIDWDKPNLFVVSAADEVTVDKTLASISSAYNNTSARTSRTADIRVLGTPRWLRYNALDKNLYFKLGVGFVSSYHADRTNARVRSFDSRYVAAFGEMPSLYSYKGYDVAKSFIKSLFTPGSSFDDRLNSNSGELLQVPYTYAPKVGSASHANTEWVVVGYYPDYTIRVK